MMLDKLESLPLCNTPEWLLDIASSQKLPDHLPLTNLLEKSLYYPSSGLDTDPLECFEGFIHSFIYVDYGQSRGDFLKFISHTMNHYKFIHGRFISRNELVPDHWIPDFPKVFDEFGGDTRLNRAQGKCDQFGYWGIFGHETPDGEQKIFSFLFISGEGVASYQGLYGRNNASPEVLAIIQPGHAFGGNWTNFFDHKAPLWQSVSQGVLPNKVFLGNCGLSNSLFFLWEIALEYGDYLPGEIVSSKQKKLQLFDLDKRTESQREIDRLQRIEREKEQAEEKRLYEIERKKQYQEWFKFYKTQRLAGNKAPKFVVRATHQEELEKQDFDRQVNKQRRSLSLFVALKGAHKKAIADLIQRGVDWQCINRDGIQLKDYAKQQGLSKLLE
jgi:hypothetical protein